jgi:microcystin-dependent protein
MENFKVSEKYVIDKNNSAMSYPVGSIVSITFSSVPQGWLLCDGQELSYSDYPELGSLFGASSGVFNIPDLNNKMLSTTLSSETSIPSTHNHNLSAVNPTISSHTVNAHTHNSGASHSAGVMSDHFHNVSNDAGHGLGNNNSNTSVRASGNITFVAGTTHNHNYAVYSAGSGNGGANNSHTHGNKSVPVNASYAHTHTPSSSISSVDVASSPFPLSRMVYYIIKV